MKFTSKLDLSKTEYNNLIALLEDFSTNLMGPERDLLNKVKSGINKGWMAALKRSEVLAKVKTILAEQTFSSEFHDQPSNIKEETEIKDDLDFTNDRLQGIIKDLLNEYLEEQGSEKSINNSEIIKPKTVKDLTELVLEKLNE